MEIIYHRMSQNLPIHQADNDAVHHVLVPSCLMVHLNVRKRIYKIFWDVINVLTQT